MTTASIIALAITTITITHQNSEEPLCWSGSPKMQNQQDGWMDSYVVDGWMDGWMDRNYYGGIVCIITHLRISMVYLQWGSRDIGHVI
jgi:hypothetical protein